MREHKYRAWHQTEHKMIYFSLGELLGNYCDEFNYCALADTDLYRWHDADDLEIMEYTGFKDFNGKDIYEGDRVSYLLRSGIVVWTEEAMPATGFVVKTRDGEFLPLAESWSVVGNIFED